MASSAVNKGFEGLRRLAAVTTVAAVTALWVTLYRSLPTYPPSLGLPLAIVAVLFLSALALLHRMHGNMWPGIAQFGFVISAVGLGLWIIGGTLNDLGLRTTDPGSVWGAVCARSHCATTTRLGSV